MPHIELVKCSSCQSLSDILCQIDEKLYSLAKAHYKQITLEIKTNYNKSLSSTLLNYKRIIEKKLFNPYYTDYNQSVLISRIKVLLNG